MFTSLAAAQQQIGSGDFYGSDTLLKHLVPLSGAGTPTATSTVPDFFGQFYYNSSTGDFWMAKVLSSPAVAADFLKLTN